MNLQFGFQFGSGWCVDDGQEVFKLYDNTIIFYEGENEYKVDLGSDMSMFYMQLNRKFYRTRTKLSTNTKAYGIVMKRNKYDKYRYIELHIPCKAVDLSVMKSDEPYVALTMIYDVYHYTFNGGGLHDLSNGKSFTMRAVTNERLTIPQRVFKSYTPQETKLRKLHKDITETIGVEIDMFRLERLLKHYRIIKKRNKEA